MRNRSISFQEQIVFNEVQLAGIPFGNNDDAVVRRLRCIVAATSGHSYMARMYLEYLDGSLESIGEQYIKIADTNVRLKLTQDSAWEERVPGCPGWFRCNTPKGF